MAYKIDPDKCIGCGSCASECSFEAISEDNGIYVIDPDKCVECGTCAEVCPNEAPKLDD